MLDKIRDDVKCNYRFALAWAVSTKYVLINHNGFSPAQLVFGKLIINPVPLTTIYQL